MKLNNKYYILRHGQSLSNRRHIIDCLPRKGYFPLTKKGRKQAEESAKRLKNKHIDLIFTSDFLRAKQTAEIVERQLKIKPKLDKRLREYNMGVFNGKLVLDFPKFLEKELMRFKKKPEKGESYFEIMKRIYGFLKDINKKYKNKNILIISHQVPLTLLIGKIKGLSREDIFKKYFEKDKIKTGELRLLN